MGDAVNGPCRLCYFWTPKTIRDSDTSRHGICAMKALQTAKEYSCERFKYYRRTQ